MVAIGRWSITQVLLYSYIFLAPYKPNPKSLPVRVDYDLNFIRSYFIEHVTIFCIFTVHKKVCRSYLVQKNYVGVVVPMQDRLGVIVVQNPLSEIVVMHLKRFDQSGF